MSHRHTRSQEKLAATAEEAELLSAAQAQAEEEALIESRLPREVLNLTRLMEHHQHTVDEIQGNLAKLTEMVVQIAVAVAKPPPTTPVESQTPTFSMPPPPPLGLSPIPKGTTPPSDSTVTPPTAWTTTPPPSDKSQSLPMPQDPNKPSSSSTPQHFH
jgi:hypothetical protein